MQLKFLFLLGFVFDVSCLNYQSSKFINPENELRKNESLVKILKKDPSSFIELFANANPETIFQVISLLEGVVIEVSSSLDLLTSQVNAAIDEQKAAQAKRDAADMNFASQSPPMIDEKRVLQQIIETLVDYNGGIIAKKAFDVDGQNYVVYKLRADNSFTDDANGNQVYINKCKEAGLAPVGCGNAKYLCDYKSNGCVPMPASWSCNMLTPLHSVTQWDNIVAFHTNGPEFLCSYQNGEKNPDRSDILHAVCSRIPE